MSPVLQIQMSSGNAAIQISVSATLLCFQFELEPDHEHDQKHMEDNVKTLPPAVIYSLY